MPRPDRKLATLTALMALLVISAPTSAQDNGAMHGGATPDNGATPRPQRPKGGLFDLDVAVSTLDKDSKKKPAAGQQVLLEVYAGEQMVKNYSEKVGPDGVAAFSKLFRIQGARYVPAVVYEGVRYQGDPIFPNADKMSAEINVYGKTYSDENLVVTDLVTTVDIAEGYLVFRQNWSLVNKSPLTFDVANNTEQKYADGLLFEMPTRAEGISAAVFQGGGRDFKEARVVENRVYVKQPVPPAGPGGESLRVQIHYSIKLLDSDFDYTQPLAYNVEGMRVLVTLTTSHKKHPRLDLSMTAPGFAEVKDNAQVPGMQPGAVFIDARGGSAKAGGSLTFNIRGYPVEDRLPRWIALMAGLIGGLGVLGFGIREMKMKRSGKNASRLRIEALEGEREALFDALRDLDDRYYDGQLTDRAYDIEVASLRERLALVLRRLDADVKDAA